MYNKLYFIIIRVSTHEADLFHLQKISTEIKGEWRDFGRNLGLSEQILYDLGKNIESTKERVREIFVLWLHGKGHDATPHSLKRALSKAGRRDLSDKIKW